MMVRAILAAVALLVLIALLMWQQAREQLVADCVAQGGQWDGPRSTCLPKPGRITIQRDLFRS